MAELELEDEEFEMVSLRPIDGVCGPLRFSSPASHSNIGAAELSPEPTARTKKNILI